MDEGAFVTVAAPPVVAAAPPIVAAAPTGKEEMRETGFFATIIGGNDSSLDDSSSLNE